MPTQAPPVSLTIDCERQGDVIIFHCRGKLVSGVCSFLYNKVHAVIPEHKKIVLDLTDLEWMDSMGMGTMVRLYVACKKDGCKLQLINLGARVKELLGITNLLGVLADIGEKGVTHY
ncbi:MAG TPA: STAS domain-containing protein [Terracidiphilus sp.]|nr:STAS domain-containing protein [Terracidiphilus sp.]